MAFRELLFERQAGIRMTAHQIERERAMRKGLDSILIRGVHVTLFKGELCVQVEIGNSWIPIFTEKLLSSDHLISHIIEPNGIQSCADKCGELSTSEQIAHDQGISFQ